MFRFIYIYTLLLIAFIRQGVHALVYMTIWNLCFQSCYFYLYEKHIRNDYFVYLQNICWTLSPIFIAYWGLSMSWKHSVLWYDISVHGINVVLFWYTLFPTHTIDVKHLWVSYIVLFSYLMVAYGYTALYGSIYPTNFFVLENSLLFGMLTLVLPYINHVALPPSYHPKRSDCLKV